uniref:Large ribosomal subunit protein uL23c n=1 Tax=Thuretia quercifolia TaxID=189650 RepID=A0A1Z1ML38_9FLOR|nr:ribosomal protein L23 [Thuretia quercifolia]ARW66461.1 ribosomal protein L23 [Thuretia quercifolia]
MINKTEYNKQLLNLIKYPIITDKTTKKIEENIYYFAVEKKANKTKLKEAIEYIFNVKVTKINTLNQARKTKRIGKFQGYINQYKKAIIKLDKQDKINLFEES